MAKQWILAVWIIGIGFGLFSLWSYDAGAGARGDDVPISPMPAELGTDVIVGVHPHCPCTRATFAELERALAASRSNPRRVAILFFLPEGSDAEWAEGDLWDKAGRDGWNRILDYGSAKAQSLGMKTSGHVAFYDAEQRLRFSGGITGSRGHEGSNRGRKILTDLLTNRHDEAREETPVFGCSLVQDSEPPPTPSRSRQ